MTAENFRQFLVTVFVLAVAALVLAAVVTPPDPFSQIRALGVLFPVALVCAYLLTYRAGLTWD